MNSCLAPQKPEFQSQKKWKRTLLFFLMVIDTTFVGNRHESSFHDYHLCNWYIETRFGCYFTVLHLKQIIQIPQRITIVRLCPSVCMSHRNEKQSLELCPYKAMKTVQSPEKRKADLHQLSTMTSATFGHWSLFLQEKAIIRKRRAHGQSCSGSPGTGL